MSPQEEAFRLMDGQARKYETMAAAFPEGSSAHKASVITAKAYREAIRFLIGLGE